MSGLNFSWISLDFLTKLWYTYYDHSDIWCQWNDADATRWKSALRAQLLDGPVRPLVSCHLSLYPASVLHLYSPFSRPVCMYPESERFYVGIVKQHIPLEETTWFSCYPYLLWMHTQGTIQRFGFLSLWNCVWCLLFGGNRAFVHESYKSKNLPDISNERGSVYASWNRCHYLCRAFWCRAAWSENCYSGGHLLQSFLLCARTRTHRTERKGSHLYYPEDRFEIFCWSEREKLKWCVLGMKGRPHQATVKKERRKRSEQHLCQAYVVCMPIQLPLAQKEILMRLARQARIFARQVQVDLLALSNSDLFQMVHLWVSGKHISPSSEASEDVRSALGYTLWRRESST